jgi:hypothetical protein
MSYRREHWYNITYIYICGRSNKKKELFWTKSPYLGKREFWGKNGRRHFSLLVVPYLHAKFQKISWTRFPGIALLTDWLTNSTVTCLRPHAHMLEKALLALKNPVQGLFQDRRVGVVFVTSLQLLHFRSDVWSSFLACCTSALRYPPHFGCAQQPHTQHRKVPPPDLLPHTGHFAILCFLMHFSSMLIKKWCYVIKCS